MEIEEDLIPYKSKPLTFLSNPLALGMKRTKPLENRAHTEGGCSPPQNVNGHSIPYLRKPGRSFKTKSEKRHCVALIKMIEITYMKRLSTVRLDLDKIVALMNRRCPRSNMQNKE
jgi:hypothetical protein